MSEENAEQRESEGRDEAEEMARLQEQINNLPVSEHILFMMQSLSSLAVDRLGLVPEGAGRRDVEQARLAIEAFKALLGALEEAQPTEELAGHRSVLSQLQLAYVGALGGATSGGTPAQEESAEAPGEEAASEEGAPKKAAPKKAAPKKATAKKTTKAQSDAKSDTGTGEAKGGGKGAAKAAGGGKKSS